MNEQTPQLDTIFRHARAEAPAMPFTEAHALLQGAGHLPRPATLRGILGRIISALAAILIVAAVIMALYDPAGMEPFERLMESRAAAANPHVSPSPAAPPGTTEAPRPMTAAAPGPHELPAAQVHHGLTAPEHGAVPEGIDVAVLPPDVLDMLGVQVLPDGRIRYVASAGNGDSCVVMEIPIRAGDSASVADATPRRFPQALLPLAITNRAGTLLHFTGNDTARRARFARGLGLDMLLPVCIRCGANDTAGVLLWYELSRPLLNVLPDPVLIDVQSEVTAMLFAERDAADAATMAHNAAIDSLVELLADVVGTRATAPAKQARPRAGNSYLAMAGTDAGPLHFIELAPRTGPRINSRHDVREYDLGYRLEAKRVLTFALYDLSGEQLVGGGGAIGSGPGTFNTVLMIRKPIAPGIYQYVISTNKHERVARRLVVE